MFLLASNMLRVAVCSALCFATARHAGFGCGHGTCGWHMLVAVMWLPLHVVSHRHAHATWPNPAALLPNSLPCAGGMTCGGRGRLSWHSCWPRARM